MDLRYAAMYRILQLGFCFLLVAAMVIPGITAQNMSINKQILNAGGLDALDVFHVLEGGTIGVRQELDMMIPLVQFSEMMAAANSLRQKKSYSRHSPWPSPLIHYEIMESIRPYAHRIKKALDILSEFTCLIFEETECFVPRLQYSSDDKGCWAIFGFQNHINVVNLGQEWCIYTPTIHHESFHSLGIPHEQNRPDRDKYIYIKPKYLSDGNWGQILQESNVQSFGIKYDYRSIMHYDIYTNVGHVKDPYYRGKTGQYGYTSFSDYKLLNVAFECSNRFCSSRLNQQPCQFNGFRITKELYGQTKCTCWCHSGKPRNEDQFVPCSSLTKSMEPVYDLTRESSLLDSESDSCADLLDNCTSLKEKGLCFTELVKMKSVCTKTCKFCGKGQDLCMDKDESCVMMAEAGVCKDKGLEQFMRNLCPKSCGKCTQPHSACDIQKAMEEPVTNIVNSAAINSQWISHLTAFCVLLDRLNN